MKIAFCGVGRMGGPMAGHVLDAGHELRVYDPFSPTRDDLVERGAVGADSPAEAAAGADVVSIVVLDDAQVLDVVTGADGVLAADPRPSIVAVHSTVKVATLRAVAAAAAEARVDVVDAGISGGEPGAQQGRLFCIAGADADVLARATPAFEPWSREVLHVGDVGQGMVVKAARNLAQYTIMSAAHEAMALAETTGVDLAVFQHLLTETDVPPSFAFPLGRPTTKGLTFDELGDGGPRMEAYARIADKDLDVAAAAAAEAGLELRSVELARIYPRSLGYERG